ncbi:Alpha/beta hydrolase family [Teratosphaeria destructans]|uniref:Alpha/beta hydrolase family n=1 Tax=Teratosphaeria destructans TaxID=418781 RepID=A0A9W7SMM3_9PEZI|nr:Alpha/beta hydrolase family [Teratosphaeria destructans]
MARKRKAEALDEGDGKDTAKLEDVNHSVLGGMKGGYRTDGEESQDASVVSFKVPFNDKAIICERRGGASQQPALIFTHGAGGGIANPATKEFANGFADISPIVCFQGTMNLQNRIKTFRSVIEHEGFDTALGGRSMGARAAVVAATLEGSEKKALVLVSFPLVGGKKSESREQAVLDLPEGVDVLFMTGSDDAQCDLSRLRKVMTKMTARSWLCEVDGADHGMGWKLKRSVEVMRRKTGAIAAEWLKERDQDRRYSCVQWDEEAEDIRFEDWRSDDRAASDQDPGRDTKKRSMD